MSVEQNPYNSKSKNSLCKTCSLFYGSQAYEGLCSGCYKKSDESKKEEIVQKSPALTQASLDPSEKQICQAMEQLSLQPLKKQQNDKKRCYDCNKKIGLLGVQCRCGYIYCNSHRLPEEHKCEFDHKEAGKNQLRKEVVKVYNGKIAEI